MVYFLGRDVDVYIFNEAQATTANATIGTSGSEAVNGAATLSQTFATAMASGGSASNTLADFDKQSDITGIDVSTGVMDEDNSFVGQMQAGKVEIKKEVTVSLTRKKNNNCWDVIFNGPINSGYMEITSQKGGARWGHADNSSALAAGLINPKDTRDMNNTGERHVINIWKSWIWLPCSLSIEVRNRDRRNHRDNDNTQLCNKFVFCNIRCRRSR